MTPVDDDKPKGILNEENWQRVREAMAVFGAEFQRSARAAIEAANTEMEKFIKAFRRG